VSVRPGPSPDPAAARALLVAALSPLGAEDVAVGPALAGRVLAADVVAPHDLPRFANSAMDGYALRAAEAGVPLSLSGRISAGDAPGTLAPGTCMAIATGAPLPAGADAVVPIERAREDDGIAAFEGGAATGDNVRLPGEDVREGDRVLSAGTRLSPLAAAGVAGTGVGAVRCARRPRVAIVATGDELAPPGAVLRPGQIHESNSLLIAARCEQLGAEIVSSELVADDAAATDAAFARAAAVADVLLTSAGVSVGGRDHVRPALARLGVVELFWRVALQPGRPIWAGTAPGLLALGLPGNPLSVLTGLELFVRPALAALCGASDPGPPSVTLELASPLRRSPDRTRALPVRIEWPRALPLGAGGSHQLARAASADGLALVPPGAGELAAGARAQVVPFADLRGA
jgi:molybdopterin molybdotransferase